MSDGEANYRKMATISMVLAVIECDLRQYSCDNSPIGNAGGQNHAPSIAVRLTQRLFVRKIQTRSPPTK